MRVCLRSSHEIDIIGYQIHTKEKALSHYKHRFGVSSSCLQVWSVFESDDLACLEHAQCGIGKVVIVFEQTAPSNCDSVRQRADLGERIRSADKRSKHGKVVVVSVQLGAKEESFLGQQSDE